MPTLIEEKGRCFTQYPGRREVQTHYDNLKVSRTASVEEIKKAYKRLIFIHHPDRHPPELKDEKTKIIQLLNEAWRTLADPALRAQHDAWIAQQENSTIASVNASRKSVPIAISGRRWKRNGKKSISYKSAKMSG